MSPLGVLFVLYLCFICVFRLFSVYFPFIFRLFSVCFPFVPLVNKFRLVAGLEHVTCVEETAYRILRGRRPGWQGPMEDDDKQGHKDDQEHGGGMVHLELDKTGKAAGEERRTGRGDGFGGGYGKGKRRSLREASALEQVCILVGTLQFTLD